MTHVSTSLQVEQFYEALLGTLKAARKQNVIAWEGQMLLKVRLNAFNMRIPLLYSLIIQRAVGYQGQHDNVVITLLIPPEGSAPPPPTEGEEILPPLRVG